MGKCPSCLGDEKEKYLLKPPTPRDLPSTDLPSATPFFGASQSCSNVPMGSSNIPAMASMHWAVNAPMHFDPNYQTTSIIQPLPYHQPKAIVQPPLSAHSQSNSVGASSVMSYPGPTPMMSRTSHSWNGHRISNVQPVQTHSSLDDMSLQLRNYTSNDMVIATADMLKRQLSDPTTGGIYSPQSQHERRHSKELGGSGSGSGSSSDSVHSSRTSMTPGTVANGVKINEDCSETPSLPPEHTTAVSNHYTVTPRQSTDDTGLSQQRLHELVNDSLGVTDYHELREVVGRKYEPKMTPRTSRTDESKFKIIVQNGGTSDVDSEYIETPDPAPYPGHTVKAFDIPLDICPISERRSVKLALAALGAQVSMEQSNDDNLSESSPSTITIHQENDKLKSEMNDMMAEMTNLTLQQTSSVKRGSYVSSSISPISGGSTTSPNL